MKSIKRILFVLTIVQGLTCSNHKQNQEQFISWRNLTHGSYNVGYKVAYEYDFSRTVKSKFNYENKLTTENNYRPIQISIWYPANISQRDTTMPYSEYVITRGSRFDYSLLTQEGIKSILEKYASSINWYNPLEIKNTDITDFIINRKTRAFKDATPESGKFPLILFCSGGGDTPSSFDVLFEYLASHGYVIAGIPSNGMFENKPSYNLMDEESQIRDMEFAMSYMTEFPNADINNICSMGYSYGGLVNVLFALRNFDIKTVLCLDGSICLKDRDRAVKTLPYFDSARLTMPFLNMAREVHDEQDFTFFNQLKYSNAYLLHFNQMNHEGFKSIPHIEDFENINNPKNRNIVSIGDDNELVYKYSLHFLDAYTKNDSNAYSTMQSSPEKYGISEEILKIDFKQSLELPPLGERFIEYIEAEGIDKGLQVYHKAKKNDPQIIIFDKNEINNLGYDFLNRKMFVDAIKVFQLFVLEYPDISNSYDSLGEAFAKNNNIKDALYNYRIALRINPYSQSAARAIKELEKLENVQ